MEIIAEFLEPYMSIGANGLLIEGIRRIVNWNEENIEVSTGRKIISLSGANLKMEHKSMDSLLIRGKIDNIRFRSVKK